jgi:sulfate transporter 3
VGRTFAALKNYQVDGNKEMMAIGLMNMAGSCSSCFVTTGEVLIFSWWLCDSEIF